MLDEAGRCVDVVKRERGEAEQMIEEFMLLANSSAAALARRLKLPVRCTVCTKRRTQSGSKS